MATLEEALNAAEVAQAGEEWTKLPDYKEKDVYSDMDYTVDLQSKTIQSLEDNVSTFGEQNSQYISFMLDRFYDGVDLKDMRFRVQYELDNGVGSVDNLVNGCYNEEYLKFGWVIPIEATQLSGKIKVMLFCTGTLLEEDYILKTKPIEYTIHNTLPIGGGIPKPDENWFLSFIAEMDEKVATAQGYADSANHASQSAEQSKLSVDESKAHIDTVAAQVESNAEQSSTDAQSAATSASAAKESEEKAKQYVDNVLAISPAQVTDAITIDPSFAGGLKVNQLYGKSEQKQYSGKNLLNATLQTITQNGVTCTSNGDGTYTLNGPAPDANIYFQIVAKFAVIGGKNYRLVGCPTGGNINSKYALFYREDWRIDSGAGCTFTPTSDVESYVSIKISAGYACNNLVFKPMLVDADKYPSVTYDDFEPYVGGIPSPNPDYPQEIKSVVEPVVVVYGKNIAKKIVVLNNSNHYGIPLYITADLRPSTTYVLSFECAHGYSGYVNEILFDKVSFVGTGNRQSIICKTKSVIQNSEFLANGWIFIRNNTGNTIIPKFTNVMLEEASVATSYEPYREQSVSLTGITLNAIPVSSGGNVTIDGQQYISDYVDVERGKIVRMVNNARLLSSYNWYTGDKYYFGSVTGATNSKEPIVADNSKKLCLCNYFVALPMHDIFINGKKGIAINNLKQVTISLEEFASADDLKTFLANNDVRLVYPLATPTEESISDELTEKLKALQTYAGVTNIFVESTELPPMVDLEYGVGTAGAYVLQALNLAKINELHIAALTAQTTTTEDEGGKTE